MVAGDFKGAGSETISASGPGVMASKEVAVSGLLTTDAVVVSFSGTVAQDVSDAVGPFLYNIKKEADKFTLYVNRSQLPRDLTFDYVALATA